MGMLKKKTEKTDKSFKKMTSHVIKKCPFIFRKNKAKNKIKI